MLGTHLVIVFVRVYKLTFLKSTPVTGEEMIQGNLGTVVGQVTKLGTVVRQVRDRCRTSGGPL